jgi:DNA polymerase III epsilon subunit-like protein
LTILTIDYETFFSDDYTLKKLSTEEYVRDPRFKAHCVAVKRGDQPATWYEPDYLLKSHELRHEISTSAVLAQHAHFDGLILSHHFGLKPAFWFDLLSLARLQLPRLRSHSLAALCQHFGLRSKSIDYSAFKGIRDLPPSLLWEVGAGACDDAELEYTLFKTLVKGVPQDELRVIDQTVRMFTEPVLELERPRLHMFLEEEKLRKANLMFDVADTLGLDDYDMPDEEVLKQVETQLQSSDKFRVALESLGYECPTKFSVKARCERCEGHGDINVADGLFIPCEDCNETGKGGWIPALAKNDDGMKELLEHDDLRVQALAAARLGVKSTIDETRANRLLEASSRGALPVYLSYGAAKTLRFGGGDKTNWQNFRRGGEIRKSIKAPEGHKLVIVDASQVECRGVNWLAGQTSILDLFRDRRDVYAELASRMFGRPVTKSDEKERWLAKQVELGSGFGLRWKGLQQKLRTGQMGGIRMALTDEEAQSYMGAYDETHPNVLEFWRVGRECILPALHHGSAFEWRGFKVSNHRVFLPNGVALDYTGLRWGYFDDASPGRDERPGYWITSKRGRQERLWHGTIVENITQALFSGLLIREAMVRIGAQFATKRAEYPQHIWKIVLQVHDEVIGVVPEAWADSALEMMIAEMSREPAWAPGFPAAAEGKISERYDK